VPRYVAITAPRGVEIPRTSVNLDAANALDAAGFEIEDTTAVPTGSYGRMGPVPEADRTFKVGALRWEGPFYGNVQRETMLASAWVVLLAHHPLVRERFDAGALVIEPLSEEQNRQILGRQLVARARGSASGGIAAARPEDVLAPFRPQKAAPAPAVETATAAEVPAPEPAPPPARPRLREVTPSPRRGEDRAT
jgi:hypothetical protein